MSGNKVLVVTKPDGTTHVMPLSNKARLQSHNSRLPVGQKWKLEEMDEEEAKEIPFIRKDVVNPGNAQAIISEKDKEIEELKRKLSALQGGAGTGAGTTGDPGADYGTNGTPGGQGTQGGQGDKPATALEAIAKINAAETKEQVEALIENEDRKTVLDAAAKKIGSFA